MNYTEYVPLSFVREVMAINVNVLLILMSDHVHKELCCFVLSPLSRAKIELLNFETSSVNTSTLHALSVVTLSS